MFSRVLISRWIDYNAGTRSPGRMRPPPIEFSMYFEPEVSLEVFSLTEVRGRHTASLKRSGHHGSASTPP